MLKSMTFNGERKPWLYLLEGRQKSPFPPIKNTLISVSNMAGAHVSHKKRDVIYISQPIAFFVDDDEDFLNKKDELAEWLNTNEAAPLQFDDEPNRTYYAEIDGTIDDFSRFSNQRKGTITFLCADPYGYGEEQTLEFPSDQVILTNSGTAEADPIFELTAKEKTTFAMISNEDDEYNLVGTPADDDVQIIDTKTSVMFENGSTLSEWSATTNMDLLNDDSNIDSLNGVMGTDNAGIRPDSYGTAKDKQRGPAIYRELDEPVQDFEIETTFDILSNREIENFRMMIYLNDENMNPIGQFGIKDNTKNYKRRRPIVHLGEHNERVLMGDSDKTNDKARNTTLFYLRMTRQGNRFDFYIGEWQAQKHINVWKESYIDIDNKYQGRLKYITLFIGSFQNRVTPSRLRINSVNVYELRTVEEDQTPYIMYPGDTLTLDHKNEDILLNGEPRMDLKNFGASFFNLKKGDNRLLVTPIDVFDTKVTFRNKYL